MKASLQHRARREAHQRGHQTGGPIEQQCLRLATREARRLPFHAGGTDDMRMRVGGTRIGFGLCKSSRHGLRVVPVDARRPRCLRDKRQDVATAEDRMSSR
jgi:hypothetical protein